MSNIYDALLLAGIRPLQVEKIENARAAVTDITSTSTEAGMEPEVIDLYRHIDALLPNAGKMVLQFIGSRAGEGVSTIVREFAAMAETRLGKSVLILDANQIERDQQRFFRITNSCGWDEAVSESEAMEKAICRVGDSNLHVSGLSRRSDEISPLFDACQLKNFFSTLKMRFDLVLIDSSPVTTGADCMALTRCTDGVVLVVEAEKTRKPVAENMVAKIRKSGGNILGLVFNKRRYHIPASVYKLLK